MTPKQRSAHRNAQRERLKGRKLTQRMRRWFPCQISAYDQLLARYVTVGPPVSSGLFYRGAEIFWNS